MTKAELFAKVDSTWLSAKRKQELKAAVEEYSSAIIAAKPNVSGSLPHQVDWVVLRQKYFSDCVVKDSVDGLKLRIDFAPHDLFQWFKKEVEAGLQ